MFAMIRLRNGRLVIQTPFWTASIATITIFLTLAVFVTLGGLLYIALQVMWAAVVCTLVALVIFTGMCARLLPKPEDDDPSAGIGAPKGSGSGTGGRPKAGRNSK